MSELPDEFIDQLIAEENRPKGRFKNTEVKTTKPSPPSRLADLYKREEQRGPVRYYDKEMRCSSRGCSSSTYIKVNGIARCMTHALKECNTMLTDAGFRGV